MFLFAEKYRAVKSAENRHTEFSRLARPRKKFYTAEVNSYIVI
jgi:hypothetical protein